MSSAISTHSAVSDASAVSVEGPAVALALDVSHLRAAWDAASRSSESSADCWSRLTTCLEQGRVGDEERRELDRALAAQAYAWAVYRCAVDELRTSRD